MMATKQLRLEREDQVERLPGRFGAPWQVFSIDHDTDDAAAVFERRHGRPPEYVLPHKDNLWLGPVPGEEMRR